MAQDKIASNSSRRNRLFVLSHHGLSPNMDFLSFCQWLASPYGSDEFADRHWVSQHRILTRSNGKLPDFVGLFERLEEDWAKALALAGVPHVELPHINVSPAYPTEQIPPDLLDKLFDRYRKDFELGRYTIQ